MKRVIALLLLFFFVIINSSMIVQAAETKPSSPEQKKIVVYIKPDVSVELNGVKLAFYDSRGNVVYPMIYNGSTYLPIRAVSGLMNEPIEWDSASKTIFIGKTLSNPNKSLIDISTNSAIEFKNMDNNNTLLKAELVSAYLKPDVLVMYDFVLQTFKDVNEGLIYPIIYNGTTYLPIRSISELMEEPIEWDGFTKTIFIGNGEETSEEVDIVENENEISVSAKKLKKLFEQEEVLYYEATAKATGLKTAATLDQKQLIANTISDNYLNAQSMTTEIKALDTTNFNKDEIEAYEKIIAFAESTEYYILVLENISYLAAQDTDYSMLAETFLYFALDSQTKMEEARTLIQKIN